MKIKFARTAGFCMGVRRAMDIVLDLTRRSRSAIFTDGPLIHNPQIVSLLEERGIRALRGGERPSGGVIVIRAHGVSPRRRRELAALGIPIRDATCPDVAKVQALVKRHARKGYDVVIVGDRGHAEVEGLLGFSEGRGRVVSDPEEARSLPRMGRVCIVAQTTQDVGLFREVAAIVNERASECVVFDTVCRSTKERQGEVIKLAARVDAVIVVGGKNSANTARLKRICEGEGVRAYHVETVKDLEDIPFRDFGRIGITAGASTPNWMIERVVKGVRAIRTEREGGIHRLMSLLEKAAAGSCLLSALGAVSLYAAASSLQGVPVHWPYAASLGLLVVCLGLSAARGDETRCPEGRHRGGVERLAAAAAGAAALSLAAVTGFSAFIVLCVLIALNYSRIAAGKRLSLPPHASARGLRFLGGVYFPAVWTVAIVIAPRLVEGISWASGATAACGYVFCLVFVRVTLRDIRSINADAITGKETIATLAGKSGTKFIMGIAVAVAAALLAAAPSAPGLRAALFLPIFYLVFYRYLYRRRYATGELLHDALDNGPFYLAGAAAVLWSLNYS